MFSGFNPGYPWTSHHIKHLARIFLQATPGTRIIIVSTAGSPATTLTSSLLFGHAYVPIAGRASCIQLSSPPRLLPLLLPLLRLLPSSSWNSGYYSLNCWIANHHAYQFSLLWTYLCLHSTAALPYTQLPLPLRLLPCCCLYLQAAPGIDGYYSHSCWISSHSVCSLSSIWTFLCLIQKPRLFALRLPLATSPAALAAAFRFVATLPRPSAACCFATCCPCCFLLLPSLLHQLHNLDYSYVLAACLGASSAAFAVSTATG